jgi:hypothetical protein
VVSAAAPHLSKTAGAAGIGFGRTRRLNVLQ